MRLRTKLLVPFAAAFALILTLANLLLLPLALEHEERNFVEAQEAILRSMEPDLARSFLNGDLGSIYGSLDFQVQLHRDNWRRIELFSADGRRLYPLHEADHQQQHAAGMRILTYRITWERSPLADLRLELDWSYRRNRILHSIYLAQGLMLLVLAAVMATTAYWQQQLVVKPVRRLAEASAELAEGDFSTPLPYPHPDEVGDLTRSFERMRAALLLAQQNLQAEARKAQQASVAKSQFLATMSHEIRTPLNGVLGMAQLLLADNLTAAERREYVRIILTSGQTLLTLLNDILDLSRVEAGGLELEYLPFRPAQLIAEIGTFFAGQAAARKLAIQAVWHSPQDRSYLGDAVRLRQMLTNLVGNAIKFTPTGSISIDGREIRQENGTACVEFSVADTGIGIPQDKLPLLFQPFSQVDASNTRKYGGTGLGLSIVRNLANLMGAEVGVESREGEGSRFWFRIQATRVGGDTGGAPAESRKADVAEGESLLYRHVLVAENDPTNRKVIEAQLKKLGLYCDSAENGAEALRIIMSGASPDLVLMDCQMPVMDGIEATIAIRRWERELGRRRMPIVALTAGAFDDSRERCLAAGMDDILTKPVKVAELSSAIGKWVGAAPARPQGAA